MVATGEGARVFVEGGWVVCKVKGREIEILEGLRDEIFVAG